MGFAEAFFATAFVVAPFFAESFFVEAFLADLGDDFLAALAPTTFARTFGARAGLRAV
jgi:hypothetical protein